MPATARFSPRRLRLVVVGALVALLALAGLVAPTAASARVVSYGASVAHPYSDPVWWPLSAPSSMDCYKHNPGSGCGGVHSQYLWDIIGEQGVNNQPVYAMGAGIVHVGAYHAGCGHAQSRGNYLYIDHGNGLLTYYGHLGKIFVRTGQYVSLRTRLAYVGNSGYARCHVYPKLRYLMVALKKGGTGGTYIEVKHTYACTPGGKRVDYPRQLPHGARSHWDAVHRTTPVPATSTSRTCATVPVRTARAPSRVGLQRHGKSTMYASWSRPASHYHVFHTVVVLSMYHPRARHWSTLRSVWLSAKTHYYKFHHLHHKRHYRVYVQFHNGWGYSAMSANRHASIGR